MVETPDWACVPFGPAMTWRHFTSTVSPSTITWSIGKRQSSSPSMASPKTVCLMASSPSTRPHAGSTKTASSVKLWAAGRPRVPSPVLDALARCQAGVDGGVDLIGGVAHENTF